MIWRLGLENLATKIATQPLQLIYRGLEGSTAGYPDDLGRRFFTIQFAFFTTRTVITGFKGLVGDLNFFSAFIGFCTISTVAFFLFFPLGF